MAFKGCDFAGGRPSPAALKAAGIAFVARYFADAIGRQGEFKNLTVAEAKGYLDAGIAIMPPWEGTATEAVTDGYAGGLAHGRSWKAQADKLGVPSSVIAWYTIDTDTSADVAEYERGFAEGVNPHPIGIYGDGAELTAAVKRGRVVKTWQTNATSWAGGAYKQANIVQGGTQVIDGVRVDLNQADSLAGMWGAATIQAVPVPAAPPAPVTDGDKMTGYIKVATDGSVYAYGDVPFLGSFTTDLSNGEVIVEVRLTKTHKGYIAFGNKGGIFTKGDAVYLGGGGDKNPAGFLAADAG